ncbi:MarR family transcriptional regulator [Agromyces bauzanensis]
MTREERSERRVAWGRYALLRALARTRAPRTQAQLAEETGVTQAAISQSLKRLDGLVSRTADGWSARNVREVADAFLTQYPGARGITTGWYSLDPVTRQAQLVAEAATREGAVISGDAGADRIAPWRKPVRAVVYGRTGLNLARHGFGDADLEHASLEYTVPADQTIWATARAHSDPDPRVVGWRAGAGSEKVSSDLG